jgi:hypothetical protein
MALFLMKFDNDVEFGLLIILYQAIRFKLWLNLKNNDRRNP